MDFRSAILRTLSFHAAWQYAPTAAELVLTLDVGTEQAAGGVGPDVSGVAGCLAALEREGSVIEGAGRLALAEGGRGILDRISERDAFQPRKRRRAAKVAGWLASLGSVRFVALANTTALGNARDEGDLDFFVVAKGGTLWTTRLLGAGPFKFLGRLPTEDRTRDAVCLSYFVSDDGLKLEPHMLPGDDPYFRYWLLSLLPLYDDGVGRDLWSVNQGIVSRHPFARRWEVPPDFRVPRPGFRLPASVCRILEPPARSFQRRWFPPRLKGLMNRDTRVIVDDRTLKFHVDDRRAEFRDAYRELCENFGISA